MMYRLFAAASAAVWIAGQASAATVIDFEDFGNNYMTGGGSGVCAGQGDDECTIVGDEFVGDGMTLRFDDVVPQVDDEIKIVRVGGNGVGHGADAFVPNDQPLPIGVFGEFFLTTEFKTDTHFSLTFNERSHVSFGIADIDGDSSDGSGNGTSDLEGFQIKAFLGNGGTDIVQVFGNGFIGGNAAYTDGVAGDAKVTGFNFSDVVRLEVYASTVGGTRNIGWGIDNIAFEDVILPPPPPPAPVPLPAGLPLILAALGGLGIVARRRNAA